MKTVTLFFPPLVLGEQTSEEKLTDNLKSKAYGIWAESIKKKHGNQSDLLKVFPAKANPISLGLLCLTAFMKKKGINVNYIHCDYLLNKKSGTWNKMVEDINDIVQISDVCGFYATTPMIHSAMQLVEAVKRINPKTVTVLGGIHATFADIETLDAFPFLDMVARGEGEETLLEIVKNSENIDCLAEGIKSTTYRSKGKIVRAVDRNLICASDIPNPDYSILPQDYDLLLTVMYSRGCPWNCKFCAESGFWHNRVRFRNPKDVVDELKWINNNYRQNVIHIADSEIDVSPKHLNDLLDCIENEKLECKYTVNLRSDAYKRLNASTLERMNKIGIIGYFIGVESASDTMLEKMNRKCTFDDFLKTIELLNQTGAEVIIPYVMLGFPGETKQTLDETQNNFIQLLKEKKISFLFPKIFIPYPGTAPFSDPKSYSITLSKDYKQYTRFGFPPPFESQSLSKDTLRESLIRFYEQIFEVMSGQYS